MDAVLFWRPTFDGYNRVKSPREVYDTYLNLLMLVGPENLEWIRFNLGDPTPARALHAGFTNAENPEPLYIGEVAYLPGQVYRNECYIVKGEFTMRYQSFSIAVMKDGAVPSPVIQEQSVFTAGKKGCYRRSNWSPIF
ncbi:Hypothetical predicted protein [Cloeon dipterum]|uniref:Uncharacterized protein n=1 Tax=Cloeon dipterum TaxID=197152 RepID=A0A8S1DUI4_9INSE|nr:Hypothetical predicted protein [Cloeon dipterum]